MFVAAGLYSIVPIMLNNISKDQASKLLNEVCPNGLVSFGIILDNKKNLSFSKDKHIELFNKLYDKSISPIRSSTKWILDSGGYQLSIGLLPRKHMESYLDTYISYLIDYKDTYDEAFTLDMPLTVGVLEDVLDAYYLNKKSYKLFTELPDHIRDKILFVSHFRTIGNMEVWNRLIYEDEYARFFKRFSIGGLVVGQQLINELPINLYTIGLLQIILYFKDHREYLPEDNTIRFHILGASNYRAVLFFYLLRELVRDKFNINLEISYDSSSLFKKLIRSRVFTYVENGKVYGISLKSRDLDKIHPILKKTNKEVIYQELSYLANITGEDILDKPLYKGDTLNKDIYHLIVLMEALQQKKIDEYTNNIVKDIYSLYKVNGKLALSQLTDILVQINKDGKRSSAILKTSKRFITSLDFVDRLNTIDDLVNFMHTYISVTKDEVGRLGGNKWKIQL